MGQLDVLFPLTPALSLGERENRTLFMEESKRRESWDAFEETENGLSRLPLPKGEGGGEGEQGCLISWAYSWFAFTRNSFAIHERVHD